MSAKKLLFMAAGAVIGFWLGGPYTMIEMMNYDFLSAAFLGAVVGYGAGSMLDPITGKPSDASNPQTSELSIVTAEEGIPISDLLGTSVLAGNIIWGGRNRSIEITDTVTTGGKGGGGGTQTVVSGYKYYYSWAQGLCRGTINKILAIYQNDILVWEGLAEDEDGSGKVDITISEIGTVHVYFGNQMEKDTYMANYVVDDSLLPPFTGLAYAVFEDAYIGQYNRVPIMRFVTQKTPEWDDVDSETLILNDYDYNPAAAVRYVLSDCAEIPSTYINNASLIAAATTFANDHLGFSGLITGDTDCMSLIQTFMDHVDAILRYSIVESETSQFELVPLRNNVSSTSFPVLSEDDIEGLLHFERKSWLDTINEVSVGINERIKSWGESASQSGTTEYGNLVLGYAGGYVGSFQGFSTFNEDYVSGIVLPYAAEILGLIWTGRELVVSTNGTGVQVHKGFTDEFLYYAEGVHDGYDLGYSGVDLLGVGSNETSVVQCAGLSSSVIASVALSGTIVGVTITGNGDLVVALESGGAYTIQKMEGVSGTVSASLSYGSTVIKALCWIEGDLIVLEVQRVVRYDGFSLTPEEAHDTYNGSYGYATAVCWSYGDVREVDETEIDEGFGLKDTWLADEDAANKRIVGRTNAISFTLPFFAKQSSGLWALKRRLAKEAYPSAGIQFNGKRKAARLQPGDRFVLVYAPYAITSMVFMVVDIQEKTLTDGEQLMIQATQSLEYVLSSPVPEESPPEECKAWSSNLSSLVTASASSENGTNVAAKAVDGDIATRWEAAAGDTNAYYEVDFGEGNEYAIEKLRVKMLSGNNMNGSIKNFRWRGTNGVTWNTLYSGSMANNGNWQEFVFLNVTLFRKYRLEVIDQWNATYSPGIWELQMFACTNPARVPDDVEPDDNTCFIATADGSAITGSFDSTSTSIKIGDE